MMHYLDWSGNMAKFPANYDRWYVKLENWYIPEAWQCKFIGASVNEG